MIAGACRAAGWLRAARARAKTADYAALLALAYVVALAIEGALRHRYSLFDDAHITFRYARNLAEGHGLVYNPGERVEGTSAFLFAVVLAGAIALGGDALHAAQLLGTLGFVATVVYTFATVALVLPDRTGKALGLGAAYAVARATPLAAYATSGMETMVFVGLLTAGLHHALRAARSREPTYAWAVLLALASLTRPEGFGFFAVVWALDALRGGAAGALVRASRAWLRFAAVYVPATLLRLAYYGTVIPNSVTAKSAFGHRLLASPPGAALHAVVTGDGIRVLTDFGERILLPVGALCLGGLLLRATRGATALLFATALAAAAVCVWGEGDWMPHYRLLVPVIPLCAMGIAFGLRVVFEVRRDQAVGRWAPVAIAILSFWLFARRVDTERGAPQKPGYTAAERHLVELGQALASVRRDDDLLATDIAGIIPYYARMKTIDMFGLCDRHIATQGGHGGKMGKVDNAYVASTRPTLLVLNFLRGAQDLAKDPAFADLRDEYWLVRTPYDKDPRAAERDKKAVLVRKDRDGLDELRRALHADLVDLGPALGDRRPPR